MASAALATFRLTQPSSSSSSPAPLKSKSSALFQKNLIGVIVTAAAAATLPGIEMLSSTKHEELVYVNLKSSSAA
ncbi:hypothetical protein L1987_87654 [Smallanthus sonchifolius]|nr:hypothetical protein L1987_87654 [Smallanthus sonchifolius]